MGKILDTVEKWLKERDGKYEKDKKNNLIKIRVEGDHTAYHMVFAAKEKEQELILYVMFPDDIPESKRLAVAEYLTRANYGLPIGNFQLDMDDGELRFKVGVDITGSDLVPTMLSNMVFSVAQPTMDKFYPGIMAICYGDKSAEEAIAAVEA